MQHFKIKKISSIRNIVLFFILFAVLESIFFFVLIPQFSSITNGQQILDMRLFYNYQEVYSIIESFGQQGIKFYSYIQLLDLLFPITYAFAFSLLMSRLVDRLKVSDTIKRISLLPFVAALFDYFENIGIFIMLKKHPANYYLVANITSILTILKFIVFVIFISISLILVGIIIKNRLGDK